MALFDKFLAVRRHPGTTQAVEQPLALAAQLAALQQLSKQQAGAGAGVGGGAAEDVWSVVQRQFLPKCSDAEGLRSRSASPPAAQLAALSQALRAGLQGPSARAPWVAADIDGGSARSRASSAASPSCITATWQQGAETGSIQQQQQQVRPYESLSMAARASCIALSHRAAADMLPAGCLQTGERLLSSLERAAGEEVGRWAGTASSAAPPRALQQSRGSRAGAHLVPTFSGAEESGTAMAGRSDARAGRGFFRRCVSEEFPAVFSSAYEADQDGDRKVLANASERAQLHHGSAGNGSPTSCQSSTILSSVASFQSSKSFGVRSISGPILSYSTQKRSFDAMAGAAEAQAAGAGDSSPAGSYGASSSSSSKRRPTASWLSPASPACLPPASAPELPRSGRHGAEDGPLDKPTTLSTGYFVSPISHTSPPPPPAQQILPAGSSRDADCSAMGRSAEGGAWSSSIWDPDSRRSSHAYRSAAAASAFAATRPSLPPFPPPSAAAAASRAMAAPACDACGGAGGSGCRCRGANRRRGAAAEDCVLFGRSMAGERDAAEGDGGEAAAAPLWQPLQGGVKLVAMDLQASFMPREESRESGDAAEADRASLDLTLRL